MRLEGKNVIFTDFNGVLNDPLKTIGLDSLAFEVPKAACPNKVFRLAKLSVETNADVVFTSSYRHSVNFYIIAGRCLRNSSNQEHVDFFKEHFQSFRYKWSHTTKNKGTSRSEEIQSYLNDHKEADGGYDRFVVLEDDEPIDRSLNPVRTNPEEGFTKKDCAAAKALLSRLKKNKTSNLEP